MPHQINTETRYQLVELFRTRPDITPTLAAEALGISRQRVHVLMRELGIRRRGYDANSASPATARFAKGASHAKARKPRSR